MSFGKSSSASTDDVEAEKKKLEKERLAKLAKARRKNRSEGEENVRRQQRSPTVLTNPLGLGDGTLG